jgi:tRNA/tmRNA/rRNA uracil-C5-methylase (TrmA/RlmC/RlmD family)
MERSVVKAIRESGADRVVLVSCNPATLARDLGLLCGTLCEDEKGQIVKTYVQSDAAVASDKALPVKERTKKPLAGSDYEILSIVPFDMFPQTKHVETLVLLCRK